METQTNVLTSDDQKLIKSLKKDFNKYKGLIIAGIFSIAVGLIIIGLTIFYPISESYFVVGLYCITIGTLTIRDIIRNKKVYQLLEKLMKKEIE